MIEEATADAYHEDEQLTGLYTMIEDNLTVPSTTTVLGVEVTVRKLDMTNDGIVVPGAGTGSGSTCSCPPRHRTAPNRSRPTGTGQDGNEFTPSSSRPQPHAKPRRSSCVWIPALPPRFPRIGPGVAWRSWPVVYSLPLGSPTEIARLGRPPES